MLAQKQQQVPPDALRVTHLAPFDDQLLSIESAGQSNFGNTATAATAAAIAAATAAVHVIHYILTCATGKQAMDGNCIRQLFKCQRSSVHRTFAEAFLC